MALIMPHASYTVDSVSSTRLRPLAHGKRSNTYDNLSNFLKRPDEDDYDWLPVAGESAPVSPTVHGSTEELNLPLSTSFLSTKPYILSVSTSALFSQESNVSERRSDEGAAARGSMSSTDYAIYNSMGASSSKHRGKPTFSQLCLGRGSRKTGIMSKTGNFLFYFSCSDKPIQVARVLGAIYLKDAIIQKTTLSFAKKVLKITPPVPRRVGWEKARSASFHIKFRSDIGLNEWLSELQRVAIGQ